MPPSRRSSRFHLDRRAVVLIIVGLAMVSCSVAQAAVPDGGGWVGLAGGETGPYQWVVKVRPGGPAGAGSSGAARPCLSVTSTWRVSRFDYHRSSYSQCAGASGRLSADEAPLIASAGQPSTGSKPKMTAVGMVFAPATRRLRITLAGGRKTTLRLEKLSRDQAHAARLEPLRYAAFVVRGAWCAERLVTENAAGRPLWDSGVDEYTCDSASQPIP
jgi:hypothetical protein